MKLSRLIHFYLAFASLGVFFCQELCIQSAYGRELGKAEASRAAGESFPVLFATDRRQVESSSVHLSFREQRIDDLDKTTYGIIHEKAASKRIPLTSNALARAGNSAEPSAGSEVAAVNQPENTKDSTMNLDELCELASEYNKLSSKGVIVYLHGCCMGFQSSAQQAAATGDSLQAPVIMYDWGSVSGSYAGSLQACERSQERFNTFMRRLTESVPEEQITIIGFSLGNQMIVDFCLQTEAKSPFKDIIMVRPDLDLVSFKSHLPRISARASQIHLYTARDDIALSCSKSLRCIASPGTPTMRLGLGLVRDDLGSANNLTVLEVSQVDPILHLAPNSIMAELFHNDGVPPADSPEYKYQAKQNGIVEVMRR